MRMSKLKWKKKGHEFDDFARNIVKDFQGKGENIYIFGAGLLGEELRVIMGKTGCFSGFIDNDKTKQEQGVNGAEVISLQQFLSQRKEGLIIIAADKKNIPDITEQLEDKGFKKGKDFYEHTDFMENIFPILSVYAMNLLYIELAQICLTERCSLKCKKCAHACYAVNSKSQDMSLELAKESADYFFHHVDIIREFVLIGGEPFLYKNLGEIIEYIGENYREKIGIFSITTNGTIVPNQSVLDFCRKYEVTIHISNYSAAVRDIVKKYEQLEEKLKKSQVRYTLGEAEMQWMDYGFGTVNRNDDKEILAEVFDRCKTPCREIRGNRYYYCVMARSVSDNLKLGIGKQDYLDLAKLEKEDRKILMEFQMGFSEKGYLDMCNHCNGKDAAAYPIPAAEQMGVSDYMW